jgi:hypothetical protein
MGAERVWAKHPDIEEPKLVARSALPQMAQSGWVEMSAAEVARHDRARRDSKAAAEAAMTPADAPAPQDAPEEGDSTTVPPAEGATPDKES